MENGLQPPPAGGRASAGSKEDKSGAAPSPDAPDRDINMSPQAEGGAVPHAAADLHRNLAMGSKAEAVSDDTKDFQKGADVDPDKTEKEEGTTSPEVQTTKALLSVDAEEKVEKSELQNVDSTNQSRVDTEKNVGDRGLLPQAPNESNSSKDTAASPGVEMKNSVSVRMKGSSIGNDTNEQKNNASENVCTEKSSVDDDKGPAETLENMADRVRPSDGVGSLERNNVAEDKGTGDAKTFAENDDADADGEFEKAKSPVEKEDGTVCDEGANTEEKELVENKANLRLNPNGFPDEKCSSEKQSSAAEGKKEGGEETATTTMKEASDGKDAVKKDAPPEHKHNNEDTGTPLGDSDKLTRRDIQEGSRIDVDDPMDIDQGESEKSIKSEEEPKGAKPKDEVSGEKPDDAGSTSKSGAPFEKDDPDSADAAPSKRTRSKSEDFGSNGKRYNKEKNEKDAPKQQTGSAIETRHGTSSGNRPNPNERDQLGSSETAKSKGQHLSSLDVNVAPYSSRHHAAEDARVFGSGPNSKEPSFLESLSEEERRTRTRHVPDVEGFRRLHKSEIKRDLKAAKSLFCGVIDDEEAADDLAAASAHDGESLATMDISDDNASNRAKVTSVGPFVPPDQSSVGGASMEAAVSSEGEGSRESSAAKKSGAGEMAQPSASSELGPLRSPHIVESITAFNPPRPPESFADKKKVRTLRWERNPEDVETDLSNYKKTVARTRKEVHIAESERERVECVGATLRSHFLNHMKALRDESIAVNREMNRMQIKCAEEAELMATRTRSRGSNSMRDVLSVLRTRGEKLRAFAGSGTLNDSSHRTNGSIGCPSGIGGTCLVDGSFNGSDKFPDSVTQLLEPVPMSATLKHLASGWLLPGDRVSTAYGPGTVQEVFGASALDPKSDRSIVLNTSFTKVSSSSSPKGSTSVQVKMVVNNEEVHKSPAVAHVTDSNRHGKPATPDPVKSRSPKGALALSGQGKDAVKAKESQDRKHNVVATAPSSNIFVIPPRVCVRLSYGVAYVPPYELRLLRNPATFTDAKLALRWQAMAKSASLVGGCPDTRDMNMMIAKEGYTSPQGDAAPLDGDGVKIGGTRQTSMSASSSQLDDDESATNDSGSQEGSQGNPEGDQTADELNSKAMSCEGSSSQGLKGCQDKDQGRVIPFGGGMLPTPGNRGDPLTTLPLRSVQASLDSVLLNGAGILGEPNNPSISNDMKEWEAQRQMLYLTKARVLTLRNQLYRQRRARIMNERGYASARERAERAEVLLTEMRADLRSLKKRLREELDELGIDDEKARQILAVHLKEQKESDKARDFRPRKRSKKEIDGASASDGGAVLRTSRRKAAEEAAAARTTNQFRGEEDIIAEEMIANKGGGNEDTRHSVDNELPPNPKEYAEDAPIPRRKRGRVDDSSILEGSSSGKTTKRNYSRRQ